MKKIERIAFRFFIITLCVVAILLLFRPDGILCDIIVLIGALVGFIAAGLYAGIVAIEMSKRMDD